MRNRDCSLGRLSHWVVKARAAGLVGWLVAALASTGSVTNGAHAAQATQGRISITLDGLTLTPSIEQKRTEHFEKLQAHLAELAGKEGGEAEALPFLEAEMAYLIQTTPRRDDRACALGIVTLAKWYFTMATADQKGLRRIMELQQPFTWSWPLDSLRRQLLERRRLTKRRLTERRQTEHWGLV